VAICQWQADQSINLRDTDKSQYINLKIALYCDINFFLSLLLFLIFIMICTAPLKTTKASGLPG